MRSALLWMKELRGSERYRRERNPGVNQTLCGCHLRESGPQSLDVWITQSPVVHLHGLHRAEAVQSLQLVSRESVDGLQEGVVCELEGRVKWDRSVQSFAPHLDSDLCSTRGDNPTGENKKRDECCM